jgi:hypothetical protein
MMVREVSPTSLSENDSSFQNGISEQENWLIQVNTFGSDMNGITIGDEAHEDDMGPQDGDESNEENGENEIPSVLRRWKQFRYNNQDWIVNRCPLKQKRWMGP